MIGLGASHSKSWEYPFTLLKTWCKGRSQNRRSEGPNNEIFIWVITLLEYDQIMYEDTKKTKINAKYMVRQSFLIFEANVGHFPKNHLLPMMVKPKPLLQGR